MQELLMTFWFAFNIIFGLWSLKNHISRVISWFNRKLYYTQSEFGKLLDLLVLTSILAYMLY